MMFDFPINKHEIMSRASSRESNYSNSSQRQKLNSKSTRSKIGDSPLTSKEFAINKISTNGAEYANTFADNYKNGTKPSERMKKFSSIPVAMLDDYNNSSYGLQENHVVGNQDPNAYPGDGNKNITQNLRLLKTKMRLGSATSNDQEVYTNPVHENRPLKATRNSEMLARNSSKTVLQNSYENQNNSIVSVTAGSLFRRMLMQAKTTFTLLPGNKSRLKLTTRSACRTRGWRVNSSIRRLKAGILKRKPRRDGS